MDRFQCLECPYIYDPDNGDPDEGIPAGTSFEDLPDDWLCPKCCVSKDYFEKIADDIF